jgi:hypothetical protein
MVAKELALQDKVGLQGASFTVDAIASSERDEQIIAPIVEAIYKKAFSSFDELSAKLKELGFDMSTPERTQVHGTTRVGCAVFNGQGREVCRLTLEADIDLSSSAPATRRTLLLK